MALKGGQWMMERNGQGGGSSSEIVEELTLTCSLVVGKKKVQCEF